MFYKNIAKEDQNRFKKKLKDEFGLIPFDQGDAIYPPFMIDIREGTESCNLECAKCPGEGEIPLQRKITLDNFQIVYDNFLDYVVRDKNGTPHYVSDIHFSGNYSDPLLNDELGEYMNYIKNDYYKKKKNIEKLFHWLMLITNGLELVKEKKAKMVARYGDVLAVSINGTNAEQYLINHGRDVYDQVLEGINNVYRYSLEYFQRGLRSAPLAIETDIVLFPNALIDLGNHLDRLSARGVTKVLCRQDFFERDEVRLRSDKKLISKYRENGNIEQKYRGLQVISKEKEEKYANVNNICVAFNRRVAMDEQGNLFHCMHLKNPNGFGNLAMDSLENIWNQLFRDKSAEVFYWPCEVGKNLGCPSGNSFLNKLGEIVMTEHVDYDKDYFYKEYESNSPLYLRTHGKKDIFDDQNNSVEDIKNLYDLEQKTGTSEDKLHNVLCQGFVLESKARPGEYRLYVVQDRLGSVFIFDPKGDLVAGTYFAQESLAALGLIGNDKTVAILSKQEPKDLEDIALKVVYEGKEQIIRLINKNDHLVLAGEMGFDLAEAQDKVLMKIFKGQLKAMARVKP